MNQLWAIYYDIVDDDTRRQVFDTLKNHGESVQLSVFECYLTLTQHQLLRQELLQLIDPKEDSLRWYPICRWCQKEIELLGKDKTIEDKGFYIV